MMDSVSRTWAAAASISRLLPLLPERQRRFSFASSKEVSQSPWQAKVASICKIIGNSCSHETTCCCCAGHSAEELSTCEQARRDAGAVAHREQLSAQHNAIRSLKGGEWRHANCACATNNPPRRARVCVRARAPSWAHANRTRRVPYSLALILCDICAALACAPATGHDSRPHDSFGRQRRRPPRRRRHWFVRVHLEERK